MDNGPKWRRARDAQVRMHLTLRHCVCHLNSEFFPALSSFLHISVLSLFTHFSIYFALFAQLTRSHHLCNVSYFRGWRSSQRSLGFAVGLRRAQWPALASPVRHHLGLKIAPLQATLVHLSHSISTSSGILFYPTELVRYHISLMLTSLALFSYFHFLFSYFHR